MRNFIKCLAALSLLIQPLTTIAHSKPAIFPKPTPVMIGGDSDQDACGGVLEVAHLNPRGDNFLTVRASPSATAREIDRLKPGFAVWGCDESADHQWIGIVYIGKKLNGDGLDCGVGTPVKQRRPYQGPCTKGWVSARFLELIAG